MTLFQFQLLRKSSTFSTTHQLLSQRTILTNQVLELFYVTIKLHRVNLFEEIISQFKDESILNYSLTLLMKKVQMQIV